MAHGVSPERGGRGRLEIGRAPGLPAVEVHIGSAFEHSYPRHWHDELFITAITGGAGVFRYGRTELRATVGTLVFIAPGEIHSHSSGPEGRSFRSVHAAKAMISELAPELSGFRSGAVIDERLVRRFLRLHRLLAKDGDRLARESLLLEFFVELAGRVPPGSALEPDRGSAREHAAVRRAREFLNDLRKREGAPRVSLGELAALSGMSPFHFHRLFRSQVGMPPHEYQLRRRILRARALLGDGRPAADVAAETGFADQSHLTRHFKRLIGVPPADYSRRARGSKNVQDAAGPPP